MISHITIKNMSNNAHNIVATLSGLHIIVASTICLFPTFENGKFTYTAYIRVQEWADSDLAYAIIRAIKDGKKTQIYIKHTQEIWELEETLHAELCYTNGYRFRNWMSEMKQCT
jgi:hypothetical protein